MEPTNIYKKGFERAFRRLQGKLAYEEKDFEAVIQEMWAALEVNNRISFYHKKTGNVEPKAGQAAALARVFMKYGIPESEVWGK